MRGKYIDARGKYLGGEVKMHLEVEIAEVGRGNQEFVGKITSKHLVIVDEWITWNGGHQR